MDPQPYWYDNLGFPDILEIPIHGWHDCVIRDEVLGWDDLEGYVASVLPDLDRAAQRDEVFSLCQHDWSSIRADPQMRATEAIVRYAQAQGLRIMTYLEYYTEQAAHRSAERERLHVRPEAHGDHDGGEDVRERECRPDHPGEFPRQKHWRVAVD